MATTDLRRGGHAYSPRASAPPRENYPLEKKDYACASRAAAYIAGHARGETGAAHLERATTEAVRRFCLHGRRPETQEALDNALKKADERAYPDQRERHTAAAHIAAEYPNTPHRCLED